MTPLAVSRLQPGEVLLRHNIPEPCWQERPYFLCLESVRRSPPSQRFPLDRETVSLARDDHA